MELLQEQIARIERELRAADLVGDRAKFGSAWMERSALLRQATAEELEELEGEWYTKAINRECALPAALPSVGDYAGEIRGKNG